MFERLSKYWTGVLHIRLRQAHGKYAMNKITIQSVHRCLIILCAYCCHDSAINMHATHTLMSLKIVPIDKNRLSAACAQIQKTVFARRGSQGYTRRKEAIY